MLGFECGNWIPRQRVAVHAKRANVTFALVAVCHRTTFMTVRGASLLHVRMMKRR